MNINTLHLIGTNHGAKIRKKTAAIWIFNTVTRHLTWYKTEYLPFLKKYISLLMRKEIAIHMIENEVLCNNCSSTLIAASAPKSLYAGIKQLYYEIKNIIQKKNLRILSRLKHGILPLKTTTNYPLITNPNVPAPNNIALKLEPGEWVEVLSLEEISATLDNRRLHKGMRFMSEMEEFCGKKFRVFKKVRVIRLESTGEIRKIKTPTVLLEGVYCDGENFEGCDRACFHYWREVWLKRIPDL